jgi:hypothetical protein
MQTTTNLGIHRNIERFQGNEERLASDNVGVGVLARASELKGKVRMW